MNGGCCECPTRGVWETIESRVTSTLSFYHAAFIYNDILDFAVWSSQAKTIISKASLCPLSSFRKLQHHSRPGWCGSIFLTKLSLYSNSLIIIQVRHTCSMDSHRPAFWTRFQPRIFFSLSLFRKLQQGRFCTDICGREATSTDLYSVFVRLPVCMHLFMSVISSHYFIAAIQGIPEKF